MKTQDEIVSAYITKLEEENKRLAAKRAFYLIDGRGVNKFLSDWWGLLIVGPFILFILSIIGTAIMHHRPLSSFYVNHDYHSEKYCVYQVYDWGEDERLGCAYTHSEAFEKAEKFKADWIKLRAGAEDE